MIIKTFGCSLTYGHGLPDCSNPTQMASPSEYAWPAVLEEITKVKVENFSKYGTSIKRNAFFAIERTCWRENDLAIFLWPNKNRTAVIMSNTDITDLGHWSRNKQSRSWYSYWGRSPVEVEHDALMRIIATNTLLEKKGVTCFHLLNNTGITDERNLFLSKNYASYLKVIDADDLEFNISNIARKKQDYGLDNAHPGQAAHRAYAELVYEKIKEYL